MQGAYFFNYLDSSTTECKPPNNIDANNDNACVVKASLSLCNKLAFTQQPSSPTVMGTQFMVQPVVTIQDITGTKINAAAVTVTLSAKIAGTQNTVPVLSGTTPASLSVATSGGVATYSGLSIAQPGAFVLTATMGTVTADSSNVTVAANSSLYKIYTDGIPDASQIITSAETCKAAWKEQIETLLDTDARKRGYYESINPPGNPDGCYTTEVVLNGSGVPKWLFAENTGFTHICTVTYPCLVKRT